MRDDLTVRDVMTRAYLGVSESDQLRDVAELLVTEEASVIAVVRGSTPQGMLNDRQLLASLLDPDVPRDTPVARRMTPNPPTISSDADLAEAASILADVSTDHLFIIEDGELAGVLSENDLLTAVTSLLVTQSGRDESDPEVDNVENQEFEDEELEDFSTQSVCELCGTLKSDLSNFNGQLVCTDCRSV